MHDPNTMVRKFNISLIEFDSDEKIICEIRKHHFGFILIFLTGLFIAGVILLTSIYASVWAENNISASLSQASNAGIAIMIVGVVITIITTLLTFAYAFIFGHNVVLVTTEKIAQILYKSLFSRKVSQLNISDVQDVTVTQSGIFAHIFNYGTLVIETAGEQQNYTFSFAPNPHECSKQIISARESNVKSFGN